MNERWQMRKDGADNEKKRGIENARCHKMEEEDVQR
jgi:hypothetical protein